MLSLVQRPNVHGAKEATCQATDETYQTAAREGDVVWSLQRASGLASRSFTVQPHDIHLVLISLP